MIFTDARIVGPWVYSRIGQEWTGQGVALGWFDGRDITAGAVFRNWNGTSLFVDVAHAPGAFVPRGYLAALFTYPFDQVGAKVILSYTLTSNQESLALQAKLGMHKLAFMPGIGPQGADVVIQALYPDNPLWRRLKNGRRRIDAPAARLQQASGAAESIQPAGFRHSDASLEAGYQHANGFEHLGEQPDVRPGWVG